MDLFKVYDKNVKEVSELTFTTPLDNLNDDKLTKCFDYFNRENRLWDFMQIVSYKTICMKSQNLFSRKTKKKYFTL